MHKKRHYCHPALSYVFICLSIKVENEMSEFKEDRKLVMAISLISEFVIFRNSIFCL